MIALDAALEFWLMERSQENRDRVIEQYGYLRARASRKFHRPGLDRADLEQIAAIGLLKACDRYDARLKTPFEAFAWLFIVGELMHYVRDYERLVRPPRRLRLLERRARRAWDDLVCELGREPSAQEIAAKIGATRRDIEEIALYREQAVPQSIEALEPHQLRPCSYILEGSENRLVIEAALKRLTPVERTIVVAIYEKGYSQLELAARLGYSRRHISRLHRAALRKMQFESVSTVL